MGGVTIPSYDYKKFILELLNNTELLSSEITDSLTEKFGITKNWLPVCLDSPLAPISIFPQCLHELITLQNLQ